MKPVLFHIVPRLPPALDGIGDYAACLASSLERQNGWESRFIVGDPGWKNFSSSGASTAFRVDERSPRALRQLVDSLQPAIAILHYAGYGYAQRGTPLWLASGIELSSLGRAQPRRLIICFHELWASGPPWRSAFYLHLPQRFIVRRLTRVARATVTSTRRMQHLLQNCGAIPALLPISSPIVSTLPQLQPKPARPDAYRFVLFGQGGPRLAAVRAHRALLEQLQGRRLLKAISVLGRGAAGPPEPSEDVCELAKAIPAGQLQVLGDCPAHVIESEMNQADFFLSACPASLACKSTAFMTALAAGCPAVLTGGDQAEPLRLGEHFLACDGAAEGVRDFLEQVRSGAPARVAEKGQAWYRRHADWPVAAQVYQQMIEPLLFPHEARRDH